jgi:hypothetical protein
MVVVVDTHLPEDDLPRPVMVDPLDMEDSLVVDMEDLLLEDTAVLRRVFRYLFLCRIG